MNRGINNIAIPVKDPSAAKARYGGLLGVEPYADQPYYVGFRAGDLEIGLDPNGHGHGTTAYYRVDNVTAGLRSVLDADGQQVQEVGRRWRQAGGRRQGRRRQHHRAHSGVLTARPIERSAGHWSSPAAYRSAGSASGRFRGLTTDQPA